jgi:hypothetical protein
MSRQHLSGKHGALPLSAQTRRRCLLMLRDKDLAGDTIAAAELIKIGFLIDAAAAQTAADRPAA